MINRLLVPIFVVLFFLGLVGAITHLAVFAILWIVLFGLVALDYCDVI